MNNIVHDIKWTQSEWLIRCMYLGADVWFTVSTINMNIINGATISLSGHLISETILK